MNENRHEEIYYRAHAHHVCSYIHGFDVLSEVGKMRVVEYVFKKCVRKWVNLYDRPVIENFYTSWNVQRKPVFANIVGEP